MLNRIPSMVVELIFSGATQSRFGYSQRNASFFCPMINTIIITLFDRIVIAARRQLCFWLYNNLMTCTYTCEIREGKTLPIHV